MIRIWAPFAKQVDAEVGGKKSALEKEEGGWWQGSRPLDHGADYGFYLDGKGPLPDPRSPWQPNGVHGLSRWVDHSRFAWSDADWKIPSIKSAIIYELHVGTFTPEGTFLAALNKLDYLLDLGITHIELMPVAEFHGVRGWGYDGVDLYAPYHVYGTPDDLKRLVDTCHRKGIGVILDVVYNHLGPIGNYLDQYGPYFTPKYNTPWGAAVNLDGEYSDEVRKYLIDNALMWLRDYHFDGLRIDAVHAIVDQSATHFLEQLSEAVKKLGNYPLIAESDLNDPRILRPIEKGGYGIDAQWNEDFHHSLHALLTKEQERYYVDFGKMEHLVKVLTKNLSYDGSYSQFRKRVHGGCAEDILPHQFIGCLQNHDQIGNRAFGERIAHLVSIDDVKIGAAITLLSPFIPMLFQGEEWGASSPFLYFNDHPELAEAIYEGRKKEFKDLKEKLDIPIPQSEETYLKSKLKWEEQHSTPHQEILDWHKALIRFRKGAGLLDRAQVRFNDKLCWLIIKNKSFDLLINLSEVNLKIPLDTTGKKPVLSSKVGVKIDTGSISLPTKTACVLLTNSLT